MKKTYPITLCSTPDWSQIPFAELTHTSWLTPCPVSARAQCCRDDSGLWIRMEAQEMPIRATLTAPLDAVWTDSCLEFFFAPAANDTRYFNFEFNPLGTLCLGFGQKGHPRVRQIIPDPQTMFRIHPFSTEGGWGIQFYLPLSFLRLYFPGYCFFGEAAGNFYKCGDLTAVPHYLAWSPLTCETPNFHRKDDFGTLVF